MQQAGQRGGQAESRGQRAEGRGQRAGQAGEGGRAGRGPNENVFWYGVRRRCYGPRCGEAGERAGSFCAIEV